MLSIMARALWAKKSVTETGDFWLPLYAHMSDAAETAKHLWNRWLPKGTKKQIASGISLSGIEHSNDDLARQVFIFLAAGHDLGKAAPVFQSKESLITAPLDKLLHQGIRDGGLNLKYYMEYSEREASHHSIVSHAILRRHDFAESVAVVLGAHHGKPPSNAQLNDLNAYDTNCGFNNENWRRVQEELLHHALVHAEMEKSDARSVVLKKPAQVLLSGLVIIADWIASDEKLFPLIELNGFVGDSEHRANEAWAKLGLTNCWDAGNDCEDLYKRRFPIVCPRPVQEELLQVMKNCLKPGIVVVEAPMGEGKTEAALAAAEIMANRTRRGGVFFALPTQATSNAMFSRVLNWIDTIDEYGDKHSILLAHGKADFMEDYRKIKLSENTRVGDAEDDDGESVIVHEWLSGRKKGILSDFVIGTIDHVLMAGLKQKHVMLRHLGLANKVVIIDECHAYDAYMSQYLEKVLNWLGVYGVPVIVLSATLFSEKRKQLIDAYLNQDSTQTRKAVPWKGIEAGTAEKPKWVDSREYPLITYTDNREVKQAVVKGPKRSIDVAIRLLSENTIADTLEEMLSGGGCAGIIVNTVKRAQLWYRELVNRFGESSVRLIHSRFISCDRASKEEKIQQLLGPDKAKRTGKLIVIGTQVLEQSLDIDFDLLFTDICPMDLLIQRMGRLHRHDSSRPEKLRDAVCLILGIDESGFDGGAEAIYGKYLLMRTKALLPGKITFPDAIPSLVQDTYGNDDKVIKIDSELCTEYEVAKADQHKRITEKESNAKKFQISDPLKSLPTLVDWLDTAVSDDTGKRGEATVRDGADSVEVIVIQKKGNNLCLLPWLKSYGGRIIPRDSVPNDELARAITGCSIRLPLLFSASWNINQAITELETKCREAGMDLWQRSHWLKGELFLILDENLKADLCDHELEYDRNFGLTFEKAEGL
jgi:CRISPR-associated endonuclease/helicase Cas3